MTHFAKNCLDYYVPATPFFNSMKDVKAHKWQPNIRGSNYDPRWGFGIIPFKLKPCNYQFALEQTGQKITKKYGNIRILKLECIIA